MSVREYYEEYWSESGFSPHGRMDDALERALRDHVRPGTKCLDVGCGDGRGIGLWITAKGASFTGVDLSSKAVAEASSLGLRASQIDDITSLPFADDEFDLVTCTEVLEHVFDPLAAARELLRVCRPDGRVLVTVPNVAYWRWRLDFVALGRWNPLGDHLAISQPWRDPHIRFFTARSLRNMMSVVGFADVQVRGGLGRFMGDLPSAWRINPNFRSSRVYRRLEGLSPSVFGYRLYATATKTTPTPAPRSSPGHTP